MSCALLPIIKDNLELLMKVYSEHSPYPLTNLTKCLNTAVMVMCIYLGKYGHDHIKKCEVGHVQAYYREMKSMAQVSNIASKFDPSAMFVKDCVSGLLSPSKSSRYLFYIMMTDSLVTNGQSFPGHVLVIEKHSNERFYLYQSYINEYDLNGHFEKNQQSFSITRKTLIEVFEEIYKLYDTGLWTKKTTVAWKRLCHVDCPQFEGCDFKDGSFFCYRKIPIKTCAARLISVLKHEKKKTLDEGMKLKLNKLLIGLRPE